MLHQLIECVDGYLVGRYSLHDLEGWLVAHLQQLMDLGDETAIALADAVDADIVELGEALIYETILRQRLESYLMSATTVLVSHTGTRSTTTCGSASADTVQASVKNLDPVVDHWVTYPAA